MWQRSTLGDYHMSLKLGKVFTVEEYIAYQRLIFCHLKGLLGGDKLVLVKPEGELGTPQQRVFAIEITLDKALLLNKKTDFICIYGVTRQEGQRLGYRGVWTATYALNALGMQHEFL
jgi:hypothetical protein